VESIQELTKICLPNVSGKNISKYYEMRNTPKGGGFQYASYWVFLG
jgi:hypothetical protein